MSLRISPLTIEDIPSAISLLLQEVSELKVHVPELPEYQPDMQVLSAKLRDLISGSRVLAAFSEDGIAGYLGWYVADHFRGANRQTAYSPDFAHAAPGPQKYQIYQALYNTASHNWFTDGCKAFGLTLLVNETQLESFWFWNGFGLLVVDAIRSLCSSLPPTQADGLIRKATLADLDLIIQMDMEHYQHYSQPPTLMVPLLPRSPTQLAEVITSSMSSIWIAMINRDLIGFMSFESASEGATMLADSASNIAVTSAYVRPQFRGKNVGLGLLENALRDYTNLGFTTCSVDFESVNPFAANFWMKFFKPICHSVMRVPEYTLSL